MILRTKLLTKSKNENVEILAVDFIYNDLVSKCDIIKDY